MEPFIAILCLVMLVTGIILMYTALCYQTKKFPPPWMTLIWKMEPYVGSKGVWLYVIGTTLAVASSTLAWISLY